MPTDLMQVYILCASSLALLILGMAFHTGTIRGFIEKTYFNPEDIKMGDGKLEQEDGPKTQRWIRAHRNSMENFLPFAVVALLLAIKVPQSAFWAACFIGFTAFRFVHAVAYINAKQPFRTLSFAGGWVLTVMISIKLMIVAV